METSDERPKRRFFQFSLRTLFALMLVAAVLFGTIGVRTVYVRDQRAVADRLSAVQANVLNIGFADRAVTTIRWEEMPSYLGMQPQGWASRILGEDFYRNVVDISLPYNRQLTDADLEAISRLDHLRVLDLGLTAITDEGLRHLGTLPRLQSLNIANTEISSEGLKYLDNAPALVSLGLSFTMIDDESIAHLAATHPPLERLDLTNTAISDASLASLARCEQLDTLILCDTDVTSAGIAKLGQLQHLRVVALNNTAVDDEAMATLAALPALEELYLRNTEISDAGIKSLAAAGKLRVLQICGTAVTDTGLADVAKIATLQTLDIRSLEVTDAGIAPLVDLDVKLLLVQNTSVTPTGLARLAKLPKDREEQLAKVLATPEPDPAPGIVFRTSPSTGPSTAKAKTNNNMRGSLPRLKLLSQDNDWRPSPVGLSTTTNVPNDPRLAGDARLSGDFSER